MDTESDQARYQRINREVKERVERLLGREVRYVKVFKLTDAGKRVNGNVAMTREDFEAILDLVEQGRHQGDT